MTSPQIPDPAYLKWPVTATHDYITARRALLEKEFALVNQIEEVAAQRRALPRGPILPTYTFTEIPGPLDSDAPSAKTTLTQLFKPGGHKTLVVYHMMMSPTDTAACSSCSMFIDGLNGVAKHLAQRFDLVIIAKAPITAVRAYAQKRNWKDLRFLSSHDNSFNKDMGLERPHWMKELNQGPGLSVFQYEEKSESQGDVEGGKSGKDGNVRFWYQTTPHFGKRKENEVIRAMDLLTPVWNLFDVTPEGRGTWDAGLDYVEEWDDVKF